MFERYAPAARQVVVHASDEARGLGHPYIGSEHLLLGLLHETGGVAARVLADAGVALDETRRQVEQIDGHGDSPVETDRIPFTPRAARVLDLSVAAADAWNHEFVGTEHVLLGLVAEPGGVAEQILGRHGVGRDDVLRQLGT